MNDSPKGIIGRVYENDAPVIYKFINEFPNFDVRMKLPCLLIISWVYDGHSNNGMPMPDENAEMIKLEDIIEENIEPYGKLRHAYSRTGNNLKELAYYINDGEQFLEMFNSAMEDQEEVPIEISFYNDPEWSELDNLLIEFKYKEKT